MTLGYRFARVNVDYDREAAFSELVAILPRMQAERYSPFFTPDFIPFSLVTDDERSAIETNPELLTWRSISLTWDPSRPDSVWGRTTARNAYLNPWAWRDDVACPYLRRVIESLPLEYLQCVRVLALPARHVGEIHNDDQMGAVSGKLSALTLNVSSGGTELQFLHKGEIYRVADHRAFIFRDDCYHGVPRARELRIQVRVNGLFKPEMADLVDQSTVLPL